MTVWIEGDRYGIVCPYELWSVEGNVLTEVVKDAIELYREHESAGAYKHLNQGS